MNRVERRNKQCLTISELPIKCQKRKDGADHSFGVHAMTDSLIEAERIIAGMTRAEKAQVLQWIARDLGDAFPGIESVPGVCGGEPCIVRTRIPVWVLEQGRRLGVGEADLLRAYPTLRAEDLSNAWAFVRLHRNEIDAQIQANEEA
jgi:uncharacterized protein (DUF433 family)